MLLALASDFVDYYDDAFDIVDRVPHRKLTRNTRRVPREEMLDYLSANTESLLYQRVVPHGKTVTFNETELVVYVDDCSVNGIGMEKLSAEVAREKYPDKYATLFLDGHGRSLKHVVVGRKNFLVSSYSSNSWKSGTGRVTRRVEHVWDDEYHPEFPMFSITYVNQTAIRMNLAPRLKNLIELPKGEIIKELKGFYES